MTVAHPISKHALLILLEQNNTPISYNTLCKTIQSKLPSFNLKQIESHVNDELCILRLVLSGLINLHSTGIIYSTKAGQYPVASKLSRHQSQNSEIVTNLRHEIIHMNILERVMIQYLNGKTSRDDLPGLLCTHIRKGELELLDDEGNKITDETLIDKKIREICNESMEKFAKEALLEL